MNTTLFLTRRDKITLRRFLLVAEELKKVGMSSAFIDLFGTPSVIRAVHEDLTGSSLFDFRIHSYYRLKLWRFVYMQCCRGLRYIRSWIYEQVVRRISARDILKIEQGALDIRTATRRYLLANTDRWQAYVCQAECMIRQLQPACVVYDLEMDLLTRAFLFAARKNGVRIISMQHGEGFGEAYSNFPQLADSYIAYSPYVVEKIRALGVSDDDIFLTGVPDADIIYRYDVDDIKETVRCEFGVGSGQKVVMAALRPAGGKFFLDLNRDLINTLGKVFGDDKKFKILIKPHNVDVMKGVSFDSAIKWSNFAVCDSSYPMSKLLVASDCMITHVSSCVVEAVMMKVPVIELKVSEEKSVWPDWHNYDVYKRVSGEEFESALLKLRDGTLDMDIDQKARERFVERFRYKFDDKASERIAEVISVLC